MNKTIKKLLLSFGLVVVTAAGVSSLISCQKNNNSNQDDKKTPNTSNDTEPETQFKLEKWVNQRRVLQWNINTKKSDLDPESPKVYAIANTLFKTKADMIGLTGIYYGEADKVINIVNIMNDLVPINLRTFFHYNFIFQSLEDASKTPYSDQKEQIAIIYNTHIYVPADKGTSFTDKIDNLVQKGDKIVIDGEDSYIRPLFGAKFRDWGREKDGVVAIFGHFDSPGVNKKNNETFLNGNFNGYNIKGGSNEIEEVLGLSKVFKFYSDKYSDVNDVIFGGDTSVSKDGANIFEYVSKKGIKSKLTENLRYIKNYYPTADSYKNEYKTSLVTEKDYKNSKTDGYSDSYDKFMFIPSYKNKTIIEIIDSQTQTEHPIPYKVDIVKSFKNGILDKNTFLNKYKKHYPEDQNPSDFKMISTGVSDHAPIMMDLISNTINKKIVVEIKE